MSEIKFLTVLGIGSDWYSKPFPNHLSITFIITKASLQMLGKEFSRRPAKAAFIISGSGDFLPDHNAHHQEDEENDQGQNGQKLRNACRCSGDAAKTQKGSNNGDNCKNQSPLKHVSLPLFGIHNGPEARAFPCPILGNAPVALRIPLTKEIAMSGTYSDPKGHKWHVPGKVDHTPDPAKDVLVDGNGSPTKIGTEALLNSDAGEDTRGVGQVNISAMPVRQEERHSDPALGNHDVSVAGSESLPHSQPVKDERQPNTAHADSSSNLSATSNVRQQRQYPEGNKPKPDTVG